MHFALKWRDQDQLGCTFAETMRFPLAARPMLEKAIGRICAIYVPRHGAPLTGFPGQSYVATTRPALIRTDGVNALVVVLEETRLLPFPVRQTARQPIPGTEGQFRGRNLSAEQWAIRPIETVLFAEVLHSSTNPLRRVPHNVKSAADANDRDGIYFGEPDGQAPYHTPDLSRLDTILELARRTEAVTRYWRDHRLRRWAIEAERGRCAITGFRLLFKGRCIGVAAAHLRSVKAFGKDSVSNICLMHHTYHDLYDRFAFTLGKQMELIWSRAIDPQKLSPAPFSSGRARFGHRANHAALLANIEWPCEEFFKSEERL